MLGHRIGLEAASHSAGLKRAAVAPTTGPGRVTARQPAAYSERLAAIRPGTIEQRKRSIACAPQGVKELPEPEIRG